MEKICNSSKNYSNKCEPVPGKSSHIWFSCKDMNGLGKNIIYIVMSISNWGYQD